RDLLLYIQERRLALRCRLEDELTAQRLWQLENAEALHLAAPVPLELLHLLVEVGRNRPPGEDIDVLEVLHPASDAVVCAAGERDPVSIAVVCHADLLVEVMLLTRQRTAFGIVRNGHPDLQPALAHQPAEDAETVGDKLVARDQRAA